MSTTCTGTEHSGQAAKKIFKRKNGAQHSTNVKKTRPNTLLAFCSVATAFAANDLLFVRPARNLETQGFRCMFVELEIHETVQVRIDHHLYMQMDFHARGLILPRVSHGCDSFHTQSCVKDFQGRTISAIGRAASISRLNFVNGSRIAINILDNWSRFVLLYFRSCRFYLRHKGTQTKRRQIEKLSMAN